MKNFHHLLSSEKEIAYFFKKLAVRALYYELALYPKPGLVSFIDSGAHSDMNASLLFKSLFTLRHYFFNVSSFAIQKKALQSLVYLGRKAEQQMEKVTNGINTHRGAVFSLGIFCSAAAQLAKNKKQFSVSQLKEAINTMWTKYLVKKHKLIPSNGQMVKVKYGVNGAKEMAEKSYTEIFTVFLMLEKRKIKDPVLYGLSAYQALLHTLCDTNVLSRCGIQGLVLARKKMEKKIDLTNKKMVIEEAIKTHHFFSANNISPGGVADMLAVIYFLKQLFG